MKLLIFVIQSTEIVNVIDAITVVREIIVREVVTDVCIIFTRLLSHLHQENTIVVTWHVITLANIHIDICPNLSMRFYF